jgi:hypothetical protein
MSIKTLQEFKDWFWVRVAVSENRHACWEWQRYRKPGGYGRTTLTINGNSTTEYAHRLAYRLHYGVFNEELCVLHRCDNPPCCNPNHLFLGTRVENNLDRTAKGRSNRFEHTPAPNCILKPEDVRRIRQYAADGRKQRRIAEEMGVSILVVNRVIRRETYKNIK